MRAITCRQPPQIVIGVGCLSDLPASLSEQGARRVMVISGTTTGRCAGPLLDGLHSAGIAAELWSGIAGEPTVTLFERALADTRAVGPDTIVAFGGGSALDVGKLVACMLRDDRRAADVFGIDTLRPRQTHLVCVPTTAGTGSEVSPNAILLDESDRSKKAVISRWLIPDATYVEPALACTMPAAITAATGIDALSHCIEAYANRRAHPMIDGYALAGIRSIGASLLRALRHSDDLGAREGLALGSLYGGLCLGPVNTAAVHALAYPLGGTFGIGHGVSIAVMLPHVLAFNAEAAPERYEAIATALGIKSSGDMLQTARLGVAFCAELVRASGLPTNLASLGVPRTAIPDLAASAMTVRRLLDNNVRNVTGRDAARIYARAFDCSVP